MKSSLFASELTNEGCLITCSTSGRSICRVHVRRIESTNDPKLRVQQQIAVPETEPYIHFTGARLSCAQLPELSSFITELLACPEMDPNRCPGAEKVA